MRFSIITPSYRNSQWLRLCIASVADQQGVEIEHIVQDSVSDDGTQDWLLKDPRVQAFIEKDQGMYDGINRGFRRATGDILAYLNCDEQYLPGALKQMQDFFETNPRVAVGLSDSVVTDGDGNYVCHRYSLVPHKHAIWVRFPVLSCGLFVRRQVVQDLGIYFDTKWRALGDLFWVRSMIERGVAMAVVPQFTSIFADTGANLCLDPVAQRERQAKWELAPRWVKRLRFPFILLYRLRLAARGSLFQKPFDYSLYTLASPDRRVTRAAARPTSFWKGRARR